MDRSVIAEEMGLVRADFRGLVERASPAELRRRSDGTRWSNEQLLFHMVFGYLIVRTLLPLVHLLGRLGWGHRFAATLDAAHRPFHLINYLGSAVGGQLLRVAWMARLLDWTVEALTRRLNSETEQSLALRMSFRPAGIHTSAT